LNLEESLVRCWYGQRGWCRLLLPLTLLFVLASALRRLLYTSGALRPTRLPIPVIVVGNLTAGGAGKTPLVIWLAERLQASGYRPGIVSRGYGARSDGTSEVVPQSDPALCGDEPVLLARRTRCPVWIGRRRAMAARDLLERNPDVNVIVADDGLQHYALARDIELVVVDGARGFGNGLRLPSGPLREGLDRLEGVDAVVINGTRVLPGLSRQPYLMSLTGNGFSSLREPNRFEKADYFKGRQIHALAGIGNPERFFSTLAGLGLTIVPHAFPDHHAYRTEDLPEGTVVMTEKDAVKCAVYAHPDAWCFAVDAKVSDGLEQYILNKLESSHGQQTA
jgi:tetraacyldisaccharide 4'-kinase